MVDGRVLLFAGVTPTAVQVHSGEVASGVAVDDAVWVQHWDYVEDEVVTEDFSVQGWAGEKVNQPLHHVTGTSLSRMNSSR